MGSGPASDRSNGEGPHSRGLILRLRSPLARPVCAEGGPSRVLPAPPARPAAPRLPHPSPWKRPARPQACTSCSLHDNAQQEPSAAPPRVSERLNQSLKAATLKAATLIALKQSPSPQPRPRRLPSPGSAAHGERTDTSAGTRGKASGGRRGGRCGRWKRPFAFPILSSLHRDQGGP